MPSTAVTSSLRPALYPVGHRAVILDWALSLTLRLSEPRYQRLRPFAFDRDASHQEILEAALVADLEREDG